MKQQQRRSDSQASQTSDQASVPQPAQSEITNEQIAELAHQKFLARGSENGHDMEDWLAAEAELRGTDAVQKTAIQKPD